MNIHNFIVTERQGMRITAKPDAVSVNITRDYALKLIQRLEEKLAEKTNEEVNFTMYGEMV